MFRPDNRGREIPLTGEGWVILLTVWSCQFSHEINLLLIVEHRADKKYGGSDCPVSRLPTG